MEEIKIGEYVRTKEWGIAKVHKVDNGKVTWVKNKNNRATHYFTQLKEPSKDLIDLIEVGDIIVYEKWEELYKKEVEDVGNKCVDVYKDTVYENEIKSIVTKEQFESMSYKVGE